MAENGIGETSVRTITEEAGANIAAVNYYFGGKDELLLELLVDRFRTLDARILSELEGLQVRTEAEGRAPTGEEIAGLYFDTILALGLSHQGPGNSRFITLIWRASSEQEPILERAQDYLAPGIQRLISLLGAAHQPKVNLKEDAPDLIGLMFSAAFTAIRATEAGVPARRIAGMRSFVLAGVTAYLETCAAA